MGLMTEAAKKILSQVLALDPKEQEALVEAVASRLDGVSPDLHPAWATELDERVGQVERGEVDLEGWDEVREAGRAALRRA